MKKKDVPGPGFYNMADLTYGPQYTFGKKHYPKKIKNLFRLEVPGVGQYNLRKDNSLEAPCFKFDLEPRKNLSMNETALKYPGPNKYNYKYTLTESSSPKWSFSKSSRTKSKSAKMKLLSRFPGPGKYTLKTLMGTEGPHFSFGKEKYNHADAFDEAMAKKRQKNPCPGSYYKNINYKASGPFYTVSKLNRPEIGSDKYLLTSPGPEKYEPKKEFSSTFTQFPVWTISKSRKDESEKIQGSKKVHLITPGPGEYDNKIGKIPDGPRYSFAIKLKGKKIEDKPGPGHYNSNDLNYPAEPHYSMGKSKKENEATVQAKKDNYPGPGTYVIHDVDMSKVFSFPKAKKGKKIKFNNPGPGQYRIPTSFDYVNNMARDKGYFDPTFRYV